MKNLLLFITVMLVNSNPAKEASLPEWFINAFNSQKQTFSIRKDCKPYFLEADFNGDGKSDIAVQIIDIKTKKRGILIINQDQNVAYVFGAGKKFTGESFDHTNWANGWKIYRDNFGYKSLFNSDGDVIGGKKIVLKHPAIYIYSMEDGDNIAGQLIYWDGKKYLSVHQGE